MTPSKRHRLYRALLLLYPRTFRKAYGDQMIQLHTDLLRRGRTKAWGRAAHDLCTALPTQRIEAAMNMGPTARIISLVLVAVGATGVVIGGGRAGVVIVLALFVVALLVALRSSIPGLGTRRAPLRRAVTQAWWAPVATLLGAALVAAGIGTIFEAHNLGGRIFGSALLIAFGGAMLLGLAQRPYARQGGNALILIGTIPAFPFFWLVVPTVAAIVVWIGVLSSGSTERAVPAPG